MKTQMLALALLGFSMMVLPKTALANPALSAFCADPINAKSPLCGSIEDMDKDLDELARRFRAIPPKVIFISESNGAKSTPAIDDLYARLEKFVILKQGQKAKGRLAKLIPHEDMTYTAKILKDEFGLTDRQAQIAARVLRLKSRGNVGGESNAPIHQQAPAQATGTLI